ncbi:hypothetical protein [Rhodopseudomonas telluris]|uniref:Uncharacterized protein n=1 Tax=Rhodopseudomonas telluris TaxID=644215 RepID=A0ABV6EQK0_9BRAD
MDTWLAIAGIVIGLWALAMAAPPLFQMIWGKPNVSIELKKSDLSGRGVQIRCYISNKPVTNRFLRTIGVVRQATEIFGDYSVSEYGTGKSIIHFERALIGTDRDNASLQATLFPATMPARFVLIAHLNELPAISISHNHPDQGTIIPAGKYVARVKVFTGDHSVISAEREFIVGPTPTETYLL